MNVSVGSLHDPAYYQLVVRPEKLRTQISRGQFQESEKRALAAAAAAMK